MTIAPERKQLANNNEYWLLFTENVTLKETSLVQYRSSVYRFLNFVNCELSELTENKIETALAETKANVLYVNSFLKFVFTKTDMRQFAQVDVLLWILSNGK